MTDFNTEVENYIQSLNVYFGDELPEGKIRPDFALISLNKWLGENEMISQLSNPKKNQEIISNNITVIARQFPVIWDEKEVYNHVFPLFPKESYIDYLSTISNSYKNLPIPNYNPPFELHKLPNFEKDWINISEDEIYSTIMEKNAGKDYYCLSYFNLQKAISNSPSLVKFLKDCYQNILSGKYNLCTEWCSANIAARYKGGDRTVPKNFRPLMILPLFVRIMDCMVSKKLHDLILKYNVIDTRVQKAIMKNSSGLWENVFAVNARMSEMLKEKKDEIFFFIDLKNAFGSINFRTMMLILQRYNFSPEFSLYFERYYKNVFGIYQKETFKWKNGLFQGSAISNILFLVYIDYAMKNIFQDLKKIKVVDVAYDLQENSFAFVDDIVMILPKNEMIGPTLKMLGKILSFYGLIINTQKTYFVIDDQEVEEITYDKIVYKKAGIEFKYLGHSLFIYQETVLENILEKIDNCLITIDSFNISPKLKAYIYFINIFLRISRIMECFYLINGKTETMDKIFETISYFVYRWGIEEYSEYAKKHFEYIFSKGSAKLMKSPNLKEYQKLALEIDISKYGIDSSKEHDFKDMLGYENPDFENLEENLKSLKERNYFPIEHYEKSGSGFYADNFVAWTE